MAINGIKIDQYKMIETKYIGPSNTRGSRIKAFDANGNSLTIGYPHELSGVECHYLAARALADKMNWQGEIKGGWTKNGCAFVLDYSL